MSTATLTPAFFDQPPGIASGALAQLLGALGAKLPPSAEAGALNQAFEDCRNRLGSYKALAERNFKRAMEPATQSRLSETNREILVLQLLDKLENLREANPELSYAIDLPEAGPRIRLLQLQAGGNGAMHPDMAILETPTFLRWLAAGAELRSPLEPAAGALRGPTAISCASTCTRSRTGARRWPRAI